MKRLPTLVLFAVAAMLTGCRQPDGAVPAPQGESVNKTEDIRRDLLNLAAGDRAARQDLQVDLANLTGDGTPEHLAEQLSSDLEVALRGIQLTDEDSKQLAGSLYVVLAGRELSERQIELLRNQVTAHLADAGVDAEAAARVGEAAEQVQQAVGRNRRRWWHLR